MQQVIAQPLRSGWYTPPTTGEGWKQLAESIRATAAPNVEAMRERLKVRVEPGTMAGVKIYTVTPDKVLPENRDRVLVQIHGGCCVLNPAEAALPERDADRRDRRLPRDRGRLPHAARGFLSGGACWCPPKASAMRLPLSTLTGTT